MRRFALIALIAAPLAAQTPPAPPGPPAGAGGPPGGPGAPGFGRRSLFISPFGEPVRGAESADAAAGQWFDRADADHDGRLTLAELKADARRFFAVLDANGDGEIAPDEIDRYENELAPEIRVMAGGFGPPDGGWGGRGGGRGPRGGGGGMGPPPGSMGGGEGPRERSGGHRGDREDGPVRQGAGRFSWLEIPEPVMSADDNLNRGIDPAEFAHAAERRFLLLDTKKQGYLTLDAMPPLPHRGFGRGAPPPPGERRPVQPPSEE